MSFGIEVSEIKSATAYIDFSVDVECPHCGEDVETIIDQFSELEEDMFEVWRNNKSVQICCEHCDKEFKIKIDY